MRQSARVHNSNSHDRKGSRKVTGTVISAVLYDTGTGKVDSSV